MSKNDFPEKDPKIPESSVDFSDLGPLFAPEEEKAVTFKPDFSVPEEVSAGEAAVEEGSEDQEISFEPDISSVDEIKSTEETGNSESQEVSFEPDISSVDEIKSTEEDGNSESQEVSFEPDISSVDEIKSTEEAGNSEAREKTSVDFSDLGPLFQSEEALVQAGEAALLLKKLSEMEQPEGTIGTEENSAEPESVSEKPEKTASEPPYEPASDAESAPSHVSSPEADPENAVSLQENTVLPSSAAAEPVAEAGLEAEEKEDPEKAETAPEPSSLPEEEDRTEEVILPDSEEEEKPAPRRMAPKGRPKRKKGEGFFGIPNLLVTVVWIAVTVLIGVTLGRMAWICAADVLAFGREDKPVTITVYEADTIEDITRKLHEGGLIRYPGLFKFYASLAVDEGEIHPGIWDLNTRYDYHALVNMMSPSSSREVIELMIPEGYSCRQIFALMEENKICTSLDLGAYAASGELDDYWFLEGVERGDMYCLEGYLFPDTYQFYKNDSPRNVLTKMLNNFGSRFDESMAAQIDTLNAHLTELMKKGGHGEEFISQHQFTVRDVINVASLVEKETSSAEEGYVIASVIYNRLFNWPDNVPYLNIDATIVYALGGKNKLTQEDLKVNSPYNTYTHTGLTPGPIANPGLSSIRAALDPSDSNYYYYVLDPALGSHRFSTTYDEHKANIASIGD